MMVPALSRQRTLGYALPRALLRVVAVVLCTRLCMHAPTMHAQALRLGADAPAIVEHNRIILAMPLPFGMRFDLPAAPASPRIGFFAWRITIETPMPFVIAFVSDTALRTNNIADVLRAATPRRCASADAESVLDCTTPIAASTELVGDHFRLIIKDSAFVAMVRRDRPVSLWRSMIVPSGRIQLRQVRFEYRDTERQ